MSAQLDPRIGMLASGRYYAFAHGYARPETIGTLNEVQAALGIRTTAPVMSSRTALWDVTLRFEYPAWDETEGIAYPGIPASSKSAAIRQARREAESDGHACRGRGRYWFTATPGTSN